MKKPNNLLQLIEELQGEDVNSTVEATINSEVIIYPDEKAADEDNGIILNRTDATLLLANDSIVERLYEALGSPASASVVLCRITLPDDALDALERLFSAVDEED